MQGHQSWHSTVFLDLYSPPALRNEFGNLIRHVRLALSAFDKLEHPAVAALGHELPAQDTILSKVHIRCEHIGVVACEVFSFKV